MEPMQEVVWTCSNVIKSLSVELLSWALPHLSYFHAAAYVALVKLIYLNDLIYNIPNKTKVKSFQFGCFQALEFSFQLAPLLYYQIS